jgi:glucose-6-phosphate 1-epimerase
MTMDLQELRQRYTIPGTVAVETGQGGLPRLAISTPQAEAHIYPHGAHLTHYQPRGERPILFVSRQSFFEPGKPIRGGVPVIFPWFGRHAEQPTLPMHGLARIRPWSVEHVRQHDDGAVSVTLGLRSSASTLTHWPHEFALQFRLNVGASLAMALDVRNTGDASFAFEESLHTYLAVGDAATVSVRGLERARYVDRSGGSDGQAVEGPVPLRFTGEFDRLYVGTRSTCVLEDPALKRRIRVGKSGSEVTVVWNPGPARAGTIADLGADEWPEFLCIETCNAGPGQAVGLAPGQSHTMEVEIAVE